MSGYTLPRGYLSASAISLLQQCPKKFEFRYVKGLTKPPTSALVTGSITHRAFEEYYSDAIENEDNRLTGKQMRELVLDSTIPKFFDENETDVSNEDRETIEKTVPDVVEKYVDNVGVEVKPKATEQEVHFETMAGVPLLAYIDLEHEQSEGKLGIIDYKVTGKPWNMAKLENSLQFQLYSYATGIPDVTIHNIVKTKRVNFDASRVKTEEPGVTVYGPTFRTVQHTFPENIEYLEDLVERCARLVTAGIFIPCDPSSWCCTPQWCDYWAVCRGRRG